MNGNQGLASYSGDAQTQARGVIAGIGSPETKLAEIPHQMERIERTLKGCHQGLDHLAGRLEASVMRSSEAVNLKNQLHPEAPQAVASTPTGSRLQEMASNVAMLNERIQGLIARLEV